MRVSHEMQANVHAAVGRARSGRPPSGASQAEGAAKPLPLEHRQAPVVEERRRCAAPRARANAGQVEGFSGCRGTRAWFDGSADRMPARVDTPRGPRSLRTALPGRSSGSATDATGGVGVGPDRAPGAGRRRPRGRRNAPRQAGLRRASPTAKNRHTHRQRSETWPHRCERATPLPSPERKDRWCACGQSKNQPFDGSDRAAGVHAGEVHGRRSKTCTLRLKAGNAPGARRGPTRRADLVRRGRRGRARHATAWSPAA